MGKENVYKYIFMNGPSLWNNQFREFAIVSFYFLNFLQKYLETAMMNCVLLLNTDNENHATSRAVYGFWDRHFCFVRLFSSTGPALRTHPFLLLCFLTYQPRTTSKTSLAKGSVGWSCCCVSYQNIEIEESVCLQSSISTVFILDYLF